MWTRPLDACITAGYEYSPGSSSSTSAACQLLPSCDTATFSGVRPFVVWLYTSRKRPSTRLVAAIPEFGLGSPVADSLPQVLPPSSDHVSAILFCRVRHSAWSLPPA